MMTDKMTLHWSPRSPYVRKVMVVAHELGVADRLHCVRTVVGGTDPHLALMQENPLGKIPTLVTPDCGYLYDSIVVCEYLNHHAQGSLFPTDFAARMQALRWQALGSGMLDISLLRLTERNKSDTMRSAPHQALWEAKIRACIPALEAEAEALAATPLNIGHVSLGVALAYLDFRFAAEAWQHGHPRLAAWHAAFSARPSVIATAFAEG